MAQIEVGNVEQQIAAQELIDQILKTGKWAEDPALSLVKADADSAEQAKSAKQWVAGWNAASMLYQSTTVPKYWEGTQVERANLPFYTVAKAVNSLTPQIVSGLFYDDPPFIIQPRPKTSSDCVEAFADIIGFQFKQIKFKEEIRRGVINATLFGTNIWKWGWDSYSYDRKYYARQEDTVALQNPVPGQPSVEFSDPDSPLVPKEETINVEQPRFENITSIRDVLVDPSLRTPDIREAKFVIHRMYMTFNDLEKLRDKPGYDLPSRAEVAGWFVPPVETPIPATDERVGLNPVWDLRANPRWAESTADPFNQPLEVLERWDKEKVIIVIQRKRVICNGPNPYGEIPFFSINWWDVPGAFYGLGLGRTIGAEQRLQQGIVNTWLDSTALALSGVFLRKRSRSIPTQSIRVHPGRVIEVDEVDDVKPMERPPAVPEAAQHIAMSQSRAEQNSGAGEISSQGIAGSSGHSNIARTAAGANLLGSGQGVAISEFIEKLCTQVFIPFLYRVAEMNRTLLPKSVVQSILNDELQSAYFEKGGTLDELTKAQVIFDVQAGAKLADRRAMAQALPLLTQFLQNQFIIQSLAEQFKKVDTEQVLKMMFESSGWRNYYSVIVDMTPEEKQKSQANTPSGVAAQKLAHDDQMQQDKFKHQQELAEQNNMARAANEVIRHNFQASATPFSLTGEAGPEGKGFGTTL